MEEDGFMEFADDSDQENIPEEENDFLGITSYTVGNSIRTIISMIEEDVICLKPEFQREFIWDMRRASKLIDSILSNLPIPNLLLGKYKKTEKFDVIDGQQRLKTVYFFIKNQFNDGGTIKPFILRGLENKQWNGKTFEQLSDVEKRKILNFTINSTILENIDQQPRIIFEIFNRLNTGGVPLRNQEVRNCIFAGIFNEALKNLNKNLGWRRLLKKDKPNKRMDDVELLLRFFSLSENYQSYRAPMREWLNKCVKINKDDLTRFKIFEKKFIETVSKINILFDENVFKGKGKLFNRSIFDAIMISIYDGIENNNIVPNPKEEYLKLLENETFQECLREGTTDHRKLIKRIDLAKRYLLKN
jgi:hypothetical protein